MLIPPAPQISHCIPTTMCGMVGPTLFRKDTLEGSRSTLRTRWLPTIAACLGITHLRTVHSEKIPGLGLACFLRGRGEGAYGPGIIRVRQCLHFKKRRGEVGGGGEKRWEGEGNEGRESR